MPCWLVDTDVLEEPAVSIFKAQIVEVPETTSYLKTETAALFERLAAIYQSKWRHILEDFNP